jgi:gluconokinase
MALDAAGEPLTGVITWADGRAVGQALRVRNQRRAEDLYQQTGCPVHGMYPLYKIIWLRENHPAAFNRAARFVSAKEYVFARLTGQYWVDYCLAAGTGLLNAHDLEWHLPALELAGLDPSQLSKLSSPAKIHQGVDPTLATEMGISSNTPLVLGSSDATNSNLGAGAVHPWQATLMVGTSGALRFIAPKPILDPRARSWCYAIDEDHWLVGGAINNGGLALSWLRDALNRAFPEHPKAHLSFDGLLELAGEVDIGADGVICLPFFAGERSPHWNLNARGSFIGLTLEHDARHLARALLEGVAFGFRSLRDVLDEIGGELREIRASGGFTQSPLWLQMMSSVLNRELSVPVWGETSSLGAAFWALYALGVIERFEEIGDLMPLVDSCQPLSEEVDMYDQLYPIYTDLYAELEGSFDRIAGLQRAWGGAKRG